jgi:Holliday junction DNA helicase RuvA
VIAFVEGIVEEISLDHVVFNINGIGYRVFVTGTTSYSLQAGNRERLYTQQHVREDAIILYGFKTKEERELFVKLQNVSGIGPKAALTIVGAAPIQELAAAIQSERVEFLKKLPGIGQKTAQRLIIELKDKLEDLAISGSGEFFAQRGAPAAQADHELFEALLSLGYNEKEAHGAVRVLTQDLEAGQPLELLIKKALRLLATK